MGTGLGARPIFNTNVLCFGCARHPRGRRPRGLLHPRRVLEGVHRGIVDGGNQSGIPVVAGRLPLRRELPGQAAGLLRHRRRASRPDPRPAMPARSTVRPGDLAVMAGGRIGKDGIHGATFSSEALSESSPTSAVQIGDPITQKKMLRHAPGGARPRALPGPHRQRRRRPLLVPRGDGGPQRRGVASTSTRCPLKYPGLAAVGDPASPNPRSA